MVLQLHIDDSGSRLPDHKPTQERADGMNCFAFGGILIKSEFVDDCILIIEEFKKRWQIEYPLHSTKIRGARDTFRWLATNPCLKARFFCELDQMLCKLPVIGIACVIDRRGYNARYAEIYENNRWLMCKTAYAILIERAVKYALRQGERLEVYFERSGKREDGYIINYHRALKSEGMPFDPNRSAGYDGLGVQEFKQALLGDPIGRTKNSILVQIADLYLYPMVKAGYNADYAPFRRLYENERIIDAVLTDSERPRYGIKYSCFDQLPKSERLGC